MSDKESFINWTLMGNLAVITGIVCFFVLGFHYIIIDEYVTGLFSFGAAYAMLYLHHLHKLHEKVDNIAGALVGMMTAFPVLGQANDNILRSIIDTNRFVMHKLLTEEEKGRLIELTSERQGDEAAEALAHWLFDGPVEALERAQAEEQMEQNELN